MDAAQPLCTTRLLARLLGSVVENLSVETIRVITERQPHSSSWLGAAAIVAVVTCSKGNAQEEVASPLTPHAVSSTNTTIGWPPLLDRGNPYPKSIDGRTIERFTHQNPTQWGYQTLQTNYFYLVHPKKKGRNAPLCVVLHSANRTALDYLGYCFLNRKVDPRDNPSDYGEKIPDDFYGLFLDSNNEEWWGWTDARSDVKKYSKEPTPA